MSRLALALVILVPFLSVTALAGEREGLRAIGQGKALFLAHCASCHGSDGRGLTAAVAGPPTPDLTRIEARDGRFDPVHVAWHVDGRQAGDRKRCMPVWGAVFARGWPRGEAWATAQVWKLTRYLDFIQEPTPVPPRPADRGPRGRPAGR
jgi:mono/diheme cytochrome c family protein